MRTRNLSLSALNQKFLLLALIANGIGTLVFSVLYQDIYRENSLSRVILVANVSITILALSAISGLVLTLVGLARAGSMTPKALAAMGVASFIVGIYSLFASFGSTIGYGDDTAACGGFPVGYWTNGGEVTRCSIWASAHGDLEGPIFLVILVSSAIIFWACVIRRVHVTSQSDR